jgi:prolyl oligopeptidase
LFSLILCLAMLAPARAQTEVKALNGLLTAEWDYTMEQNPSWASQLGDRRWNDRWEDVSLANLARNQEHLRAALARLNAIPREKLSGNDLLNRRLFQYETELALEEYQFQNHLTPLTQREGIQLLDEVADALRFETVKDYEDWVSRLRTLPAYVDQTIELMREGIRQKRVQPKVTMQRVTGQIEKQLAAMPEVSPFFKPFREYAATIPESDRTRLTAAARATITGSVFPAYQRFKEFFAREYFPACLDKPGAWQWPDGEKVYTFLCRKFTTTRMTPREIHDTGLREVERIGNEMEVIMKQVGFKGTRQEFFKHLRTDPKFYFKTPGELLTEYRAVAKRVDPLLVKVFKTLPRMPYGVEPIPDKVAPDTTAAYYRLPAADGSRAGSYFVNLYKPEMRPKYEMMALSLHEAVPGHHLQFALQFELGELPSFRRYGGERAYTAYVEGWALYAESLGDEMGLYDDPYSKFGQLTYEMWRAVRLVVDTGIHAFQWDRQRAIDFFLANAAKSELDVVNEVDRYISWPGQALAYKIGELKIKELRSRATSALGAKFDVREFHEVVLQSGAIPLEVLERRIDEWIAGKK